MKVGFFSPLPPSPTGVADYSAALLTALRKRHEVAVADPLAEIALYHIGNNHLHREIYARALEHPGVVVIHDAVLQHFFLGTFDQTQYVDEFVFNYGEWTRGLAEDLWKNRARSAADPRYFQYPMLKRIVTASRAVIVHNPAAARVVLQHNTQARVFEIPHLFAPPAVPDAVETLRFRERLGLGPRTLLVGVFGHLRESKRLSAILRAMELLWERGADATLLVQGDFASSDLERALAPRLVNNPRILRTGYLPDAEFWRWASATDVCLNLRFPSAAETSGIAVAMMGIGKAVVFTAGEEIARIPGDACLRVDASAMEERELADYLVWLVADREAATEIGRRAAAYIAREHAVEKVAAQYSEALVFASSYNSDRRDEEQRGQRT
ncbi:MAG TPA: glycosyltransferase family 4 protein [Bryobacteraceae bacterium]|jgi:glycosyltransferase involved in cell wall biosynthesis